MHRWLCPDPLLFSQQYGWTGVQEDIEDLATALGRLSVEEEVKRGYVIVSLQR
jgi:hypothetical protein